MDKNNAPDVEVEIAGRKLKLLPVLGQMKALQKKQGGLLAIMRRLSDYTVTIEDLAAIISFGSSQEISVEAAEEAIFREGMLGFLKPCATFITDTLSDGPSRPNAQTPATQPA